ncbi:hypothetical protein BAU07_26465 (plasmid) [Bordetella flabilis]|uniref:Uncharacterized protein n=1 Tax=Bordetella flabilis TaxID=463014 RepID=A0A193GMN3_9BORD|nr:hypothetical protein BAU07_26465 [Bordetella flabilis]
MGAQLTALMTGLADQKIKAGANFIYDGGRLFASDVAEIALPCALVMADSLSRRLGMGGCGYEFELGAPNPVFPVHAIPVKPRAFSEVAPYVTDVFEGVIFHLRHDLVRVYALAVEQMGYVLPESMERPARDDVPAIPAGAMDNRRAVMGTGGLSLGR